MNPSAILALIANLYEQVAQLQAENAELNKHLNPPVDDTEK